MDFLLDHANSWIFAWVAFVVFAFIIARYGIGPVLRAVENRDAKIREQLEESERTFAKARELQAKLDEQLQGAEARIAEMIREGRRDAETTKASIVEEGRREVDAIRMRAQREIEAARHEAVVSLKAAIAEIATEVAGRILDERLDPERHQELVGAAIAAFEQRQGADAS